MLIHIYIYIHRYIVNVQHHSCRPGSTRSCARGTNRVQQYREAERTQTTKGGGDNIHTTAHCCLESFRAYIYNTYMWQILITNTNTILVFTMLRCIWSGLEDFEAMKSEVCCAWRLRNIVTQTYVNLTLMELGLNIPAGLAPAHDCPKIVVSLWRQRDFMWQTTIKKKHPLYCGLQPLQGFVLQNPTNEQSGLFSSPHERSCSFASCGQQVGSSVFPSPLLTSSVLEQQTIAFALDLGTNDITPHPTPPHA